MTLLLTSFDTWKVRQRSNSSDDLLTELQQRSGLPDDVVLLRKLPVDFKLAPELAIARITELQPCIVICCGMAEKRSRLTIESNGKYRRDVIHTAVNLERLINPLATTTISHDAGKFVCNRLYYSVLKHCQQKHSTNQCIFVHVPILNAQNLEAIVKDFLLILEKMQGMRVGRRTKDEGRMPISVEHYKDENRKPTDAD